MLARQKRWIFIVGVAAVATAWTAWPFVTTAAFLLDVAGSTGALGVLLPSSRSPIAAENVSIPTRHGRVEARFYAASPPSTRTAVVFPGVHGGGVDEPRLDRFSRILAATGMNVLTVPLPDLRVFRITGQSTDVIEDVTLWTTTTPRLAPRGRVGLFGASFAGGLVLVAAARPALADRLDAVLSIGGHGDLGRVLRYLCTGVLPDGTRRPPHDYGLAIVALAAAPRLGAPEDADRLERAIRTYLAASLDETPAQTRATALLADARREAAAMREPSRSIMTWINDHDVAPLGAALEPYVDELARDPRLSPERSPATTAPVFLLHGTADNVIPSSETQLLDAYFHAQGRTRVRTLITPVLSHMDLHASASVLDQWRVVSFWKAVRDAME